MGIINMIKSIKEIHGEDVVLVKMGSFYYAYGGDAYVMSYLFGYKLNMMSNIYTCAFPIANLNKVMAKLER